MAQQTKMPFSLSNWNEREIDEISDCGAHAVPQIQQ
jgi:hypothetical protein